MISTQGNFFVMVSFQLMLPYFVYASILVYVVLMCRIPYGAKMSNFIENYV